MLRGIKIRFFFLIVLLIILVLTF